MLTPALAAGRPVDVEVGGMAAAALLSGAYISESYGGTCPRTSRFARGSWVVWRHVSEGVPVLRERKVVWRHVSEDVPPVYPGAVLALTLQLENQVTVSKRGLVA